MRALRWTGAAVMVAVAIWIGVDMMREAYGAGSPLAGSTPFMRSWTSPWLTLIAAEGLVLLIVATLLRGTTDKTP